MANHIGLSNQSIPLFVYCHVSRNQLRLGSFYSWIVEWIPGKDMPFWRSGVQELLLNAFYCVYGNVVRYCVHTTVCCCCASGPEGGAPITDDQRRCIVVHWVVHHTDAVSAVCWSTSLRGWCRGPCTEEDATPNWPMGNQWCPDSHWEGKEEQEDLKSCTTCW